MMMRMRKTLALYVLLIELKHQKNLKFSKIEKVKISDETLAYEYGLEELPSLVYYRKKIPIVYSGMICSLILCFKDNEGKCEI